MTSRNNPEDLPRNNLDHHSVPASPTIHILSPPQPVLDSGPVPVQIVVSPAPDQLSRQNTNQLSSFHNDALSSSSPPRGISWDISESQIEHEITKFIRESTAGFLHLDIFFAITFLSYLIEADILLSFFYLLFYQCARTVLVLRKKTDLSTATSSQRLRTVFNKGECFLKIIFFALCTSYIFAKLPTSILLGPLLVYLLSRLILFMRDRDKSEILAINDVIIIVFRIFLFLQSLLICLKIDNLLDVNWKGVFWVYWVFFAIMSGVSLGVFIIFVNRFCIYENASFFNEAIGLAWVLLAFPGSTAISCVIVLMIIGYLNDERDNYRIFQGYIVVLSFFTLLAFFTYIARKEIVKFLRRTSNHSAQSNNRDTLSRQQSNWDESQHSGGQRGQVPRVAELINDEQNLASLPVFLYRLSSTYFSLSGNGKKERGENAKIGVKGKGKKKKAKRGDEAKRQSFIRTYSLNNSRIDDSQPPTPFMLNPRDSITQRGIPSYRGPRKASKNENNGILHSELDSPFLTINSPLGIRRKSNASTGIAYSERRTHAPLEETLDPMSPGLNRSVVRSPASRNVFRRPSAMSSRSKEDLLGLPSSVKSLHDHDVEKRPNNDRFVFSETHLGSEKGLEMNEKRTHSNYMIHEEKGDDSPKTQNFINNQRNEQMEIHEKTPAGETLSSKDSHTILISPVASNPNTPAKSKKRENPDEEIVRISGDHDIPQSEKDESPGLSNFSPQNRNSSRNNSAIPPIRESNSQHLLRISTFADFHTLHGIKALSELASESEIHESVNNGEGNENENEKENEHDEDSKIEGKSKGDEKSVANCLICFDKRPDSVLMPCGHGGICYECALEIWQSNTECHLCRKRIFQILQIAPKEKGEDKIKVISVTKIIRAVGDESAFDAPSHHSQDELG